LFAVAGLVNADAIQRYWTGYSDRYVGSYLKNFSPIHDQNYSVVHNRPSPPHLANQVLLGVSAYNQRFHDFNTSFNVNALGLDTGAIFTGAPSISISGFDGIGNIWVELAAIRRQSRYRWLCHQELRQPVLSRHGTWT
jgi:hypothetical protein